MKNCRTALKILLVCIFLSGAHASVKILGQHQENVKAKRDVDVTAARKSVVLDWQAVCEELKRLNLAGPGCGSHGGIEAAVSIKNVVQLSSEKIDHICPILCVNNLGSPTCSCKTKRSVAKAYQNDDKSAICDTFCKVNYQTLVGCSDCPLIDGQNLSNSLIPSGSGDIHKQQKHRVTSTNNDVTTEPDWETLCFMLCQVGEGGVLCNCDLPPFFRK